MTTRFGRRTLLGGAALAVAATSTGVTMIDPTPASAKGGPGGRFDRPQDGFTSVRKLRSGSARSVGLDGDALQRGWDQVVGFTAPPPGAQYPLYPGAVLLYGHQGTVVWHEATGFSRRYADATAELPRTEWIETRTDTIYDLASVSKLFTSIITVQLIESGDVELAAPVITYLPEFAPEGKEVITVEMLLTHTSGFPSWLPLYSRYPDVPSRIKAVMDAKPTNVPGSTYLYSDLNLITLGVMAERLTGKSLDVLVAERIAEPLGMVDTGYNPTAEKRQRIAATEYQAVPARGMVWGEVHDENAWSLDGVAGHAGVFSTAKDLAALAQALLNGGTYNGKRILSERSVEQLITNYTTEFAGNDHGLGFELNQRWYMGGLSSPRTAGHTGYTGTSLVIDYLSGSFAILLSNRVHPSRSWGSVNPARVAAANGLADALRVLPVSGRSLWVADETPSSTSTLDLEVPEDASRVDFSMLIDVEATDPFSLLASTDGGTTWTPVTYTLNGRSITGPLGESGRRRWETARATLPKAVDDEPVLLRFAQTRDGLYDGRGLFLDKIQLRNPRGRVVADAEKTPSLLTPTGWTLQPR